MVYLPQNGTIGFDPQPYDIIGQLFLHEESGNMGIGEILYPPPKGIRRMGHDGATLFPPPPPCSFRSGLIRQQLGTGTCYRRRSPNADPPIRHSGS